MQFLRILFWIFFCSATQLNAQQTSVKVMIDAGHGGNDPGHLSNNSAHKTEKELNLLIAQKFGNYVSTLLQNVEIVYSRTTDVYLTLDERVEIANSKGVDIFISIHCNANEKTKVHGTESHIHSFDAKKSVELARTFEKEFSGKAGRTSRGVKDNNDREHSLQVLKYTKMTSVLVECGFLTNTREANYLNTTEGQDIIASALFRGLRTFLQKNYPSIAFVRSADKKKSTEEKKDEKFYVQITSSIDAIDTEHDSFKRIGNTVIREKLNTTNAYKYRYLIGEFATKKEAEEVLKKVKTKGFPDAFVVKK